jgi:sigma-B regulation protein RsbU (phosphoserine phosphatase)
LKEGQIIVVGTDGIWEAISKNEKMFGKDRFRNIIRQNAQTNAENMLNAVHGELIQFTKGRKSEDDITASWYTNDTSAELFLQDRRGPNRGRFC